MISWLKRHPLLILSALIVSGAAQADVPADQHCQHLNDLMKGKYKSELHTDYGGEAFSCPSILSVEAQLMQDLDKASRAAGAPDFYGFVTSRVRELQLRDNGKDAVAEAADGVITLFGNILKEQGREYNLSTLYHEARHLDANDPGHVTCEQGEFDGDEGSCDAEFFGTHILDGSGYHYDVQFMHFVLTNDTGLDGIDADVLREQYRQILFNRFNRVSDEDVERWDLE